MDLNARREQASIPLSVPTKCAILLFSVAVSLTFFFCWGRLKNLTSDEVADIIDHNSFGMTQLPKPTCKNPVPSHKNSGNRFSVLLQDPYGLVVLIPAHCTQSGSSLSPIRYR